jgi:hypothetical protein
VYPTGQPSGQPSARPTIAHQQQVSFDVSQAVDFATKDAFLADANAVVAFQTAIANLVPGLLPENIKILNVTEFTNPDTLRAVPSAITHHREVEHAPSAGKHALAANSIKVKYRVTYAAQKVLDNSADPQAAFQVVSTRIQYVIHEGLFNPAIQAAAAALNSPSLQTATAGPYNYGVDNYRAVTVHSAKPSSQPSSSPSGQPTRQPTRQPSRQPSSTPTAQPSSAPTGRPTSQPSFSLETRWVEEVGVILQRHARSPLPHRTSYYALEASGAGLLGSCDSWHTYLTYALPEILASKVVSSLALDTERGALNSTVSSYECHDEALVLQMTELLAMPLPRNRTSAFVNASVQCSGHRWVIQDCMPGQGYTVASTAYGYAGSRALCVDCDNPCAAYDCATDVGTRVISPCTRVENCPYLSASAQVFSADYADSAGTGFTSVFVWYGAMWGFIILSVLVYNQLILMDLDWKALRCVPRLTFREVTPQLRKSTNFKAIIPEPASATGSSRPGTALRSAKSEADASRDISAMMQALFDRIIIAAGQNRALYAVNLLPVMQQFWYRMLSYNHYLAPYTSTTQRERLLHGLDVLTRVSWLFFCVALCLWLNYPEDDDSCYFKATTQECGQRVTPFDSSQEYCTWVGAQGAVEASDDGGQSLYQAQCVWRLPTGTLVTVLHIVVVTVTAVVVPRIVYTNFLLKCVLLAPGGLKKAFAYQRKQKRPPSLAARFTRKRVGIAGVDPATSTAPAAPTSPTTKKLADETDSRFFSLTLTENQGNPLGYLESGDGADDMSLLFRSFMFEFTKTRNITMAVLDEKSVNFEREWAEANPFIWSFGGSLRELTEEVEVSNTVVAKLFPPERTTVAQELSNVYRQGEQLAPAFKDYLQNDEDQFSVRLMALFFADLLGKDSIQCRLVRAMLRDLLQDSAPFRDVRNWVKFCVILFMLATCMCLVYGSIALLEHFSARRQWYWVIAAALAVAVDMVLVEGVEALWFQWALPLCVADTLTALRQTFADIMHKFQSTASHTTPAFTRPKTGSASQFASSAPSMTGTTYKDFSMPNYQFVSTNLAQRFPRHVASRIVLSYESVYPRTITGQRWPNTATIAQILVGGQRWSSGLGFESIGYVLISYCVMLVGIYCSVFLQQIILTGLVSLTIWLVSWLVFTIIAGKLVGVYICSAVVAVLLTAACSYRFSWDHDSEHYESGVEALHVLDDSSASGNMGAPNNRYEGSGLHTPVHGHSSRSRTVQVSDRSEFGPVFDHFPPGPESGASSPERSPLPLPFNHLQSPEPQYSPPAARSLSPAAFNSGDAAEAGDDYFPDISLSRSNSAGSMPDLVLPSQQGLQPPQQLTRPTGAAMKLRKASKKAAAVQAMRRDEYYLSSSSGSDGGKEEPDWWAEGR